MKKLFTYFLSLCAIISCLQEERSPEEILVPTLAEVESTESSLMFTSKVPKGSEKLVEECGFYYGTDKSLANATKVEASMDANNFAVELPERNYGTTYYICSYITNGHGSEIRSEVSPYNLKPFDKYISFEPVELVSYSKASRKAEVAFKTEIWSGVRVSEVGVCFGVTTSPSTDGKHQAGTLSEEGVVTATLSNFDVDTQYYLRAYVRDGEHTVYGEVIPLIIKLSPPTLSSVIVSSVEASSALFSSSVTNNGGDSVSEVGFYYSTEETMDPETSYKVNQPYSDAEFSLQAKELVANTKYYVKAFAVNSAGTGYSQVSDFTISAASPTVSTLGATDVTESSALISGEVVSDNGAAITERGFVWVKGTDIPTISSNRVKVEGTIGDYTVALSGLYPNQSYSYRAYARNSKGIAYGETLIFKTLVALPELELVLLSDITSSSAVVSAKVTAHGGETVSEVGFLYGTTSSLDTSTSSRVTSSYNTDYFLFALDNLSRATEYYIRPYATNSAGTSYGETAQFVTLPELPSVTTSEVTDITETTALCGGVITDDGGGEIIAKGVVWSRYENPTVDQITKTDEGGGETLLFTSYMSGLFSGTTYYVRAYVTNEAGTSYGEQKELATYGAYIEYFDSANSFIVSEAGTYMFGAVKGNSMQSVGSVASVKVLWESFGTDEVPEVGSLISSVSYNNGTITFSTPNTYREGNAVIAAKDASGITLWSWHIWLTDQPQEHVYNNYAGTMMDRNLGATSATPGDVGALGLIYQWGRKDPFLGTSSISSSTIAKSTISWPSPVSSDSSKGTIDYAISNPTTFIRGDEKDEIDWYYTDSDIIDDTRWQSEKTIYDPCPSGWRVPDGGDYGVWEAAGFSNTTFDSTNRGFSFSISNPSATWYPAAGGRYSSGGHWGAGYDGSYWSVTPIRELAFELSFSSAGFVSTSNIVAPRARGLSVRCFKEDID
ncbi:MAG: hypothetical protein J6S01_11030 [Bacteroidales bacterium]|nr:hypothetical protein [Bacteroidales bacterium]